MFEPQMLPRTLEAVERDVTAPRSQVRLAAVLDARRHTSGEDRDRAVAALTRALREDATAEVRAEAALGLADAAAEQAVEALVEAYERDAALSVRQRALLALGECLGADAPRVERVRVERVLAKAAASEEPSLRFQALIARARVAFTEFEATLPRALRDEDAEVRYIALRLAEEHRERLGVEPVRRGALEALRDASPAVRAAAAIVLARLGDERGDAALVEAVGNPTLDLEDRGACIELCGERGLQRAVPALAREAYGRLGWRGGPLAWQALVALSRLGEARAAQKILSGLRAWSRDRRTFAVVAAGHARLSAARQTLLAWRGDARQAEPEAVEQALARLEEGAR